MCQLRPHHLPVQELAQLPQHPQWRLAQRRMAQQLAACILANARAQLQGQLPLFRMFVKMIRAIVWPAGAFIQLALTLMVRNQVPTTRALALQAARLPLPLQVDLKLAKMNPRTVKAVFVSPRLTILQMSWWIKPMLILACSTPTRMGASQRAR